MVVPLLTLALGLVVWLILGRALRPVEELRRGAALVASTGGPGSLPVPARDDELGALARTLNSMLDRLEAGAARQRAFVADAAHELRSPLATLRASIEVARAHPESYDTGELAADLEAEVLRMQALVDDLLLLARVGLDAVRARRTSTSARVARDVVPGPRSSRRRARASGHALAGDGARSGACCATSSTTPCGTRAPRSWSPSPTGSCRSTTTARGSPPADRERVFERFVRLDDARERDAGGSGLGLAIAREIAREQGGDVVLGESPLGGLRAELRLPVRCDVLAGCDRRAVVVRWATSRRR